MVAAQQRLPGREPHDGGGCGGRSTLRTRISCSTRHFLGVAVIHQAVTGSTMKAEARKPTLPASGTLIQEHPAIS